MSTYSAGLRAKLDQPRTGFPGKGQPPGWLLDRMAEEKLSGGYSNKRNPVCPGCHVRMPNTGQCDTCE